MNRALIILLLYALLIARTFTAHAGVKHPDTFVLATYGTVRTLDPAVCYDTSGSQRIWNLYETLIFFDGSKTDELFPSLATQVPTLKNGGISADGKTYTFPIRKGVRFHEGGQSDSGRRGLFS